MITKKINLWLENNYDEIVLMTKKITKNKEYRDIAHYMIENFIKNKMAETLIDNNEALKYISGMIYRTYFSSTSPWALSNKLFNELNNNIEIIDDEYDYKQDFLIEQIENMLNEKQTDVALWFNITLLKMWIETPNYTFLSKQLAIPRTTISRAVNEARKHIKNKIKHI